MYIHIIYTTPKLRIKNYHSGIGKGAWPLQREHQGSKRERKESQRESLESKGEH